MSEDGRSRDDKQEIAELTPCSVGEALRRETQNIKVDDGQEMALSLNRRGHHRYFARVQVREFNDLQLLGLVPRRLKEKVVRDAIASDDEESLRLARKMIVRQTAPSAACGCGTKADHFSFSRNLRSTYRDIRRDHHPALSRVLSEHFGTGFAWDSTLAGSVRGWTRRFVAGVSTVPVLIAADITIGRNSTLLVDDASYVLLARAINIHRTGKLVHRGGFLRIWARSIERFFDWGDIAVPLEKLAPWHLDI